MGYKDKTKVVSDYNIINILFSAKYALVFAMARSQIFEAVRQTLETLFNYGKASSRLLDNGEYGLLTLIATLMGPRFNESLFASNAYISSDAIIATVVGMNDRYLQVEVRTYKPYIIVNYLL